MDHFLRVAGGIGAGWRAAAVVAALAAVLGLPGTARAQAPVDCGNLNIELADFFTSPICYKSRFQNGTGRYESIHGESTDYLVNFRSSRSGAGSTYLHALDFPKLMDYYGMTGVVEVLGREGDAGDGFDYVSVGAPGYDSCILFLKQVRPIRNGYRANYFGLACDKRRNGEYSPQEAEALLDLIKDY